MNPLLTRAASAVWSLLSSLAHKLVLKGVLKPQSLGVRTISVGNIQAGGTGKTPLVAWIAREAIRRGHTVCILTRGYGGSWERSGGVIYPQGHPSGLGYLSEECGDEPLVLHHLVPEAYIGVGADRIEQFKKIRELSVKSAINFVILDDGFQHWKVKRDLDIVALTSATPWQKVFRNHFDSLARADLVVWTKGEQLPGPALEWLKEVPLVKIRYRLAQLEPSVDPVLLVTGVADGDAVFRDLKAAGLDVKKHIQFPDHARYSKTILEDLLFNARQERQRLVTTGKDWVKWKDLGVEASQVSVLEPEIVFENGKEIWDRVLWES